MKRVSTLSLFSAVSVGLAFGGGAMRSAAAQDISVPENHAAQAEVSRPLVRERFEAGANGVPGYVRDVNRSQIPQAIGLHPIRPVERIEQDDAQQNEPPAMNASSVALSHTPLRALISIDRTDNPFSLDASMSERINLDDALRSALGENLDIARSFAQLAQRKYSYLASISKFLPDINGGYNLIGVNGTIPGAVLSATPMKLPSSVQLLSAGFTYHAYQGGQVLFSTLEQRHRLRAARAALKGSTNDVLLQVARLYNDLVLNQALLDVRARAVEISAEQVRMNANEEHAGIATGLDVLQAQAQLASDQQNLVEQQQQRRLSALSLANALNTSFALDLTPAESELAMRRLIAKQTPLDKLLAAAIENRPELRQYEELRLAARRAIAETAAPLQPKVDLTGTVYGVGGESNLTSIKLLNLSVVWTLGGLGTTDLAKMQAARWQARDAALQARQIFQSVFQQVRTSYDESLCAEARINRADAQIGAAEEELRIADKRKQAGVGLNIDVLNAQRDLTQARVNKARALVDFNNAQSQLLHDVGVISVATLTHGAVI